MTQREAMIAACATSPLDELPRLVLADWMDEHGEDTTRLRWWCEWRPILHELPEDRQSGLSGILVWMAADRLVDRCPWVYPLVVVTACRLGWAGIHMHTSKRKIDSARRAIMTLLHGAEMLTLGVWDRSQYSTHTRSAVKAVNSQSWRKRVDTHCWQIGRAASTALDPTCWSSVYTATGYGRPPDEYRYDRGVSAAVELFDLFREAAPVAPAG